MNRTERLRRNNIHADLRGSIRRHIAGPAITVPACGWIIGFDLHPLSWEILRFQQSETLPAIARIAGSSYPGHH
jgi:hypothetical protein